MATKFKSKGRRSRRFLNVAKPSGSLHPRVQKVGPEHFGIVAVDCAKARSKWMLADFYGRILIEPSKGSTQPSPRSAGRSNVTRSAMSSSPSSGRESTTYRLNALSHQSTLKQGSFTR